MGPFLFLRSCRETQSQIHVELITFQGTESVKAAGTGLNMPITKESVLSPARIVVDTNTCVSQS